MFLGIFYTAFAMINQYYMELEHLGTRSARLALIMPNNIRCPTMRMYFATYNDQHNFEGWSAQLARDTISQLFQHNNRISVPFYDGECAMREANAVVALYREDDTISFAVRLPTDDVYLQLDMHQAMMP